MIAMRAMGIDMFQPSTLDTISALGINSKRSIDARDVPTRRRSYDLLKLASTDEDNINGFKNPATQGTITHVYAL